MRRQAALLLQEAAVSRPQCSQHALLGIGPASRRFVQINASPALDPASFEPVDKQAPSSAQPDAQFEVLGTPFSLLSVSLAASQNLYTRKGSLVGLSGKSENAVSTLSVLDPFRRVFGGIPFLYQKISSATPITALLSTRSATTSFAVVHLDGRLDWQVAQRSALLAWTGQTLSITPTLNTSLSLAHWGNTRVTGRGILGLSGSGQIFQIALKPGEEYVAHPANVLAYTVTPAAPQPYRLKSLRLQVPRADLGRFIPETKFFSEIARSAAWKWLGNFFYTLRTWTRVTVWGDRLFLRFQGPATILLQSRGSRVSDVLSTRQINEIADAPAGEVQAAMSRELKQEAERAAKEGSASLAKETPSKVSYATVGGDRQVTFEDKKGV